VQLGLAVAVPIAGPIVVDPVAPVPTAMFFPRSRDLAYCSQQYCRTGLQSDKEAYLSACSAAHESILKSRADHIKSELDEVAGDVRATWRTAQRLLHRVVYDDAQCAQIVLTFCQFFVDKVRRIRDNISAALQSSVPRTFTVCQHLGPQLSSFEPVTAEELRKLLPGMPSKSSPLDILPCSLL